MASAGLEMPADAFQGNTTHTQLPFATSGKSKEGTDPIHKIVGKRRENMKLKYRTNIHHGNK